MGQKIIYFVRHGEYTPYGGLSELGIRQIERVARLIQQDIRENGIENIVIYSSPIFRATESAEIIKRTLGLEEIVVAEELDENELRVGELVEKICKDSIDCAVLVGHRPGLENYLGCPVEKGEVIKKIYEIK